MIEGGGRNLDCIMGNNQGDKMNYKNILKYTIGLPVLLFLTCSFPIEYLMELILETGHFLVTGDFSLAMEIEDIKKLWKPIK